MEQIRCCPSSASSSTKHVSQCCTSGLGWSRQGFLGNTFSTHSIGLRNICVFSMVLLGIPFALALHISSSVFGAAGIPEQRTCKKVLRGLGSLMGRVISCRSCWLLAAGGQHQLQCRSAATPRVCCSEFVPSQCLATKQTGTSKLPINQQNASLPTCCC